MKIFSQTLPDDMHNLDPGLPLVKAAPSPFFFSGSQVSQSGQIYKSEEKISIVG
jgi:hypothetical protein